MYCKLSRLLDRICSFTSWSAFWNDNGMLVGVCTTNVGQGLANVSVTDVPEILGLNVWGSTQQSSPQRKQARRVGK